VKAGHRGVSSNSCVVPAWRRHGSTPAGLGAKSKAGESRRSDREEVGGKRVRNVGGRGVQELARASLGKGDRSKVKGG